MSRAGSGPSTGRLALLIFLVSVGGLGGCADDSASDHQGLSGGPEMGSPDQTWQHVQRSLNGHDAEGWANSLATTFEYVPDPVSAADFPNAYISWDREVEIAFAQAMFAAKVEFDADLVVNGSECPAPSGSTVAWPDVEYSVVVSGSGGASPVTYRGYADLEFSLEGGFWYLSRWEDVRGAPAPWNERVICPTFGGLRAVYRDRSIAVARGRKCPKERDS